MKIVLTKEIFEAFRAGDEKVFRLLMQENYRKVFCYVRNLTQSQWKAEEISQDVFVKLWTKRTTLKSPDSFNAFLFTIAKHTALDYLKKNAPDTVSLDYVEVIQHIAPDVSSVMEAKDLDLLISITVENMPHRQKLIFKMSRYDGKSIDDIAAELGISKNTVMTHLHRALGQIKSALLLVSVFISILNA